MKYVCPDIKIVGVEAEGSACLTLALERKGAFSKFLNKIGSAWDITLFHYRNHGAVWGRVLVGFSVQGKPIDELRKYLAKVGCRYWEETDNEGYNFFLG